MTQINPNASDYVGFVQKAVKRNTASEVIDAKQSGTPVNKEAIQSSNQAIRDKAQDVGLAVYQAQQKNNTLDTFVTVSQEAKDYYTSSSSESATNQSDSSDIAAFDAQAVNEARSTVQKRAAGIAVYENIQAGKNEQ